MGGRGANFGSAGSAKTKMDSAAARMEKYRTQALPGKGFSDSGSEEYYKAQREFNSARADYNKELDKKPKLKSEAAKKTFVNGFGEATIREISTPTYRRAQKKLKKNVDNWLGGR